ncbi:MAG: hypothetical protein NC902_07020 [Candidatus Omnitrophica bacterium]|nr:hypothetical protein [Candidatus Omnitrophota bacterium]
MSNNWKISPRPSLRKRGEQISPFSKGGLQGDFGNEQQLENLPTPLFKKEGRKNFPLF